jgi:hypothetical protein
VNGNAFHDLSFIPQTPAYACVNTQLELSC